EAGLAPHRQNGGSEIFDQPHAAERPQEHLRRILQRLVPGLGKQTLMFGGEDVLELTCLWRVIFPLEPSQFVAPWISVDPCPYSLRCVHHFLLAARCATT